MKLNDLLDDGKTKAAAACVQVTGWIFAVKSIENMRERGAVDPLPVIRNDDRHFLRIADELESDFLLRFIHIFYCVVDNIGDHPSELLAVRAYVLNPGFHSKKGYPGFDPLPKM